MLLSLPQEIGCGWSESAVVNSRMSTNYLLRLSIATVDDVLSAAIRKLAEAIQWGISEWHPIQTNIDEN